MSKQEAEAKLQNLSQRLEEGWNNLHSLKESQLEAIRDVVREQYNEQQQKFAQQRRRAQKSQSKKSDQSKAKGKSKQAAESKKQTRRRGHTH